MTVQNTFLSISGIQIFAGRRQTRTTTRTSSRSFTVYGVHLKKATQGPGNYNKQNSYPAKNAINGSGKFTHTNKGVGRWWRGEFGGMYHIAMVKIRNRKDCCGQRLAKTKVFIGTQLCGQLPDKTQNGKWYVVQCKSRIKSNFVKLVTVQNEYLSITGIKVFTTDKVQRRRSTSTTVYGVQL
jgi:hypothetical protein